MRTPQTRVGRWSALLIVLLALPIVIWLGLTLLLVFLAIGALGAVWLWIRSIFRPTQSEPPSSTGRNTAGPAVIEAEYELISRKPSDREPTR